MQMQGEWQGECPVCCLAI